MNYRKCKVIILPTDNFENVYFTIGKSINNLFFNPEANWEKMNNFISDIKDKEIPQHLYITSTIDIKVGDPYITSDKRIVFWLQELEDAFKMTTKSKPSPIIATTNPTLNLPKIPIDFLKKYYELKMGEIYVKFTFSVRKISINHFEKYDYRPKLTSDNYIFIKPTKEYWSKEELFELMKEAYNRGYYVALNYEPEETEKKYNLKRNTWVENYKF